MGNFIKIVLCVAIGLMTMFFQNCADDVDLSAYEGASTGVDIDDDTTPPPTGVAPFNAIGDLIAINGPLPRYVILSSRYKTNSPTVIRTGIRSGTRVEWRKKGSATLLPLGPNPNPSDLPLSPFNNLKAGEYEVSYIDTASGALTRASVDVILDETATVTPVYFSSMGPSDLKLSLGTSGSTSITLQGSGVITFKVYKLNFEYKKILPEIATSGQLTPGETYNLNFNNIKADTYGWYRFDFTNEAGTTSAFYSLSPP
jgi:hypothetical protein